MNAESHRSPLERIVMWLRPAHEAPLPAKDPMDNTLSPSSTQWVRESYCPKCKATTSHSEVMAGICSSCGLFAGRFGLLDKTRVTRQIWNGDKWVTQNKYGNGPGDFDIAT